jgi:hypothetical protein
VSPKVADAGKAGIFVVHKADGLPIKIVQKQDSLVSLRV